tara:strand:- start:295 stop:474 length:180 start_codon:yes stop_codon:yes gene_type:complete
MASEENVSDAMVHRALKEKFKDLRTFSQMRSKGLVDTGAQRPAGVLDSNKLLKKKFRSC